MSRLEMDQKAQQKILATVLIVIVGAVGLYVGIMIIDTTTNTMPMQGRTDITNETWTVNTGTYVELANGDIVEDSETVWNSSGTEMVRGTDYEMNYTSGEIKALSGGDLTDGNTAEISYEYKHRTDTFNTIDSNVDSAFVLIGVGFIVIAAGFIIGALITRLAPGLFDFRSNNK